MAGSKNKISNVDNNKICLNSFHVSLIFQANEANYEEVPIEQFGMAMLRGMGWKEGEGIGKKSKK